MTARLNPFVAHSDLMAPMIVFGTTVAQAGLEKSLMALVKIRASQINGCAICLDMHTAEARLSGETEQRIFLLDAWRESPLYSKRERAALAWTEALTRVADTRAPDEDYAAVAAQFSEEDQVKLTLLIVVINGFNRIGAGFRLNAASAVRKAA